LTSIFHRKISADSFFLPFEISANSDGSHSGSKIISAQVSQQKILFSSKYAKSANIS
jgi:hypothetical protein